MNTWIISDFHFAHRNILKYDPRPEFKNEYHMNQILIDKWNELIKPEDQTYVLGDLFCGVQQRWDMVINTIQRLNGHIILIRGNHDHNLTLYEKEGIEVIRDHWLVKNGILLSHYPMRESKFDSKKMVRIKEHLRDVYKENDCWFHFFGHTHKEISMDPNEMNVCCNLWDYYPILVLGMLD